MPCAALRRVQNSRQLQGSSVACAWVLIREGPARGRCGMCMIACVHGREQQGRRVWRRVLASGHSSLLDWMGSPTVEEERRGGRGGTSQLSPSSRLRRGMAVTRHTLYTSVSRVVVFLRFFFSFARGAAVGDGGHTHQTSHARIHVIYITTARAEGSSSFPSRLVPSVRDFY